MNPSDALRELRALVGTYLEGSDDAPRAAELLDALDPVPPPAETASARWKREERERDMFGVTAAALDEVLADKEPRDVAMYAMGTLSNAQERIQCVVREGKPQWLVADHDANRIRQEINIAKYAINKAVPR